MPLSDGRHSSLSTDLAEECHLQTASSVEPLQQEDRSKAIVDMHEEESIGDIDEKDSAIRFVAPADLRAQEATDKPPDGSYAWMVIFACLISLMLSIGINDAYGVFQQHYQLNEFPNETATLISWIGTVQFLVMCLGGLFSGFLCEHFDTRVMNALGALIMGGSFIGGSYCKTVKGLMFTQGLLYGLGASFPFVAGTSIPSQWFTKRRGLATGIALSGSGIGGMWMTSATQALIESYGRPWAMRITGIIAMVAVLAVSPWMRVRLVPILGKSQEWGSNMDTLMNGLSVVGRLAVGFLADITGPLNLLIANTVLAVISLLVIWVPFDSVGVLFAVDILFGFAIGGMVSVIPVVASHVFGLARLPSIIGLLFGGYIIGGLLGVPPMSALLDNVGHRVDYSSSILYMALLPNDFHFTENKLAVKSGIAEKI
ncbi:hypothetical protein GGI07_000087 [Coemansia sp. Benny D115]|nr:hypothetical protein GGI07_000087 [Coemansia sp. Benny D115]